MKKVAITCFSMLFLLMLNITTKANNTKFAAFDAEPINGYWQLSDTKTETYNGAKYTQWTTGETITATSVWKDILNIEHTVASSFKWEPPPDKMLPGLEITMSGIYDNIEYSTPNRVFTGIKIFMDRAGASFYNVSSDAVQVVNVNKDNKTHTAELQKGRFIAPKHFTGEGMQIQITVDCFIGKDHYITTYIYNFIESSNL
ncbi:MAG: hypothetical protein EHM58_13620 [Ignavibacteriae bacterium]|nr:MAG: hypothetical protein EHM58_13620 [Ignavibacteriota bacterium]